MIVGDGVLDVPPTAKRWVFPMPAASVGRPGGRPLRYKKSPFPEFLGIGDFLPGGAGRQTVRHSADRQASKTRAVRPAQLSTRSVGRAALPTPTAFDAHHAKPQKDHPKMSTSLRGADRRRGNLLPGPSEFTTSNIADWSAGAMPPYRDIGHGIFRADQITVAIPPVKW